MTALHDHSFVSSVVFLEFVDYTRKSVAEQIALKQRFNALLSQALAGIPPTDRIVLDASDGAAISFVGDPEDALHVAMRLRDGAAAAADGAAFQVRIGINTGAVKLVKDANGQPNIVGDGIDVAQRVMSFAEPGTLLASRAFFELVSVLSQDHAQQFKFEGSRTDHNIREHHVYLVGAAARDLRGGSRATHPAKRKQQLFLAAALAAAVILALAVGVRMSRGNPAALEALPVQAAPAAVAPAPPVAEEPTPKAAKAKPGKPKTATSADAPAPETSAGSAAAAQGVIDFAIAPWGEVYVDGAKRGVSPPLREVQIAPGKHTIEVRNTSFPSYNISVEVTSGGQAHVRYKFQ